MAMRQEEAQQILDVAEFVESFNPQDYCEPPPAKKAKLSKKKDNKIRFNNSIESYKEVNLFGNLINPLCDYNENNIFTRPLPFGQYSKLVYTLKDVTRRNGQKERIDSVAVVRTYFKDGEDKEFSVRIDGDDIESLMIALEHVYDCLLYTSPSPRDKRQSRMPSSA